MEDFFYCVVKLLHLMKYISKLEQHNKEQKKTLNSLFM